MNPLKLAIVAVLVLAGIIIPAAFMFQVNPREQVLLLRFGEVLEVIDEPGLHYKMPFINNVERFDRRLLDLDVPPQEVIASDKKRMIADAFARYQIVDPVKFYASVTNVENANNRLGTLLQSALRDVVAENSFIAVLRDEREPLMDEIQSIVNTDAAVLGVEIADVKIRRADLPEENEQAVHDRMRSDREKEAAEIRAFGEEQALRTRANADREVSVLLADARREADELRGAGDKDQIRILAEAYGQHEVFFNFYRTMESYRRSLASGETTIVIDPATDRYLDLFGPMQGNEEFFTNLFNGVDAQ